jgi:hypothetical protein
MKKQNRSFNVTALLVAVFLAFSTSAIGQVVPIQYYHGALLYAFPHLGTVPAVNPNQPTNIQTDYLWLNDAFADVKPGFAMAGYIQSLTYADTLKYLGSVLYEVVDDNPITFARWATASTWPYHYGAAPGQIRVTLQSQFSKVAGDTNRTAFLLDNDIIADVTVTDTQQYMWPSDPATPRSVVVTCDILDRIKGQSVPQCVFLYKAHSNGKIQTLSVPFPPIMADTVPATSGTCFQFEYRPNWRLGIPPDYTYPGQPELTDSTGDWIKKDSEYVVFLNFVGVWSDSANSYYSLSPDHGWFGSNAGLYPVRGGVVYDPNDDFGIGASVGGGLTVSQWKTRVRAKISSIVTP